MKTNTKATIVNVGTQIGVQIISGKLFDRVIVTLPGGETIKFALTLASRIAGLKIGWDAGNIAEKLYRCIKVAKDGGYELDIKDKEGKKFIVKFINEEIMNRIRRDAA